MKRPLAVVWLLLIGLLPLQAASAQSLEGRDFSIGTRSYHYPEALGELRGPVSVDDVTWLGVGPVVYGFDDDGLTITRLDFSGPVRSLDGSQGMLTVTAGEAGAQDTYSVQGGEIRGRVVFIPMVSVTQWLERAAMLATPAEVSRAPSTDPTNPFLALRRAEQARLRGDTFVARSEVQRAVSLSAPFPATVKLAAALEAQGLGSAVNLLLARAARDFLARGYDPALPVSHAAMLAYGDPQGEVKRLLKQQQLERAEVWLQYLRRTTPRAQGMDELYTQYMQALEAQGRMAQAQQWRDFALSLRAGTLYNLGPQSLSLVAAAARLLVLTLAISSLVALLYIHLRYQPEQRLSLAPYGGFAKSWAHPLARLRRGTLAFARRGEKLLVVSLLCALVLSLLGWNWAGRTQAALTSEALNIGTYGGSWFYEQLSDPASKLSPLSNGDAALLRGLSAQLDGDETQARQFYQAGGDIGSDAGGEAGGEAGRNQQPTLGHSVTAACMQNNLGVLYQQQGNPARAQSLWRKALSSNPEQVSAAYNLGSPPVGSLAPSGPPGTALCYPDQRSSISAFGGSLLGELPRLWHAPWQTLQQTPTGLSKAAQQGWSALLLLLTGYSLLALLLPPLAPTQPRAAHLARTHWLAWLLPGAAFLRSSWGVVPLLAWAFCVLELAAPWLSPLLTLPPAWLWALLAGNYALNTLLLAQRQLVDKARTPPATP